MSKEIAQTILSQLGGNRFASMTGAKNFMAVGNGLTFKLPHRLARGGINYVKITLTPSDVYEVIFYKIGNFTKKNPTPAVVEVAKHEEVYCDELQEVFEAETGLVTKLF